MPTTNYDDWKLDNGETVVKHAEPEDLEHIAQKALAGENVELSKVDDVSVSIIAGCPKVSLHFFGDDAPTDADALRLIGLAIKQAGQRLMDEFEFGRH